jgi:hypothetical protein
MGYRNWNTYIQVKGGYADSRTRIARYLMSLPPGVPAYFVSPQGWGLGDRVFEFLVPGRIVGELSQDSLLATDSSPVTPALLLIAPDQSEFVRKLQIRDPGGSLFVGPGNSDNEIAFYAFSLPPSH